MASGSRMAEALIEQKNIISEDKNKSTKKEANLSICLFFISF
jgi:hypothetical protein